MYKLFSIAFFSLTLGTFIWIITSSSSLFSGSNPWWVLAVYLVLYSSFALLVICESFLTVKKSSLLSKLLKGLPAKLPWTKKVLEHTALIRNLVGLATVLTVTVLSIFFAARLFTYLMATAFKDEASAITQILTQGKDPRIDSLLAGVSSLKESYMKLNLMYMHDAEQRFIKNNKKTYVNEEKVNVLTLTYVEPLNFPTSNITLEYRYDISICLKDTSLLTYSMSPCANIFRGLEHMLVFGQDELIENVSFYEYFVEGHNNPVFLVSAKTDLQTVYKLFVPMTADGETHYYQIITLPGDREIMPTDKIKFIGYTPDGLDFEVTRNTTEPIKIQVSADGSLSYSSQ
jgi:hypothetical protein